LEITMDRILVATDGSKSAGKAVATAAELAKREGARLTILHVEDQKPLSKAETEFGEVELGEAVAEKRGSLPESVASLYSGLMWREAAHLYDTQSMLLRQAIGERILGNARTQAIKLGAPEVDVVSAIGDAAHEIVAAADRTGADLIVVGRRGLG
jgi:nucleotide-binding universal stress UspA family protein